MCRNGAGVGDTNKRLRIAPIGHGGSRMSPVALAPHPNIISVGRIASPFVAVDYEHL